MKPETLVDDLLKLTEGYSNVYRKTIVKTKVKCDLDETNFEKIDHRESLLEHVGHLPILATYLHPHIENSEKVDLGRSLSMLAIHDIAEIELGDLLTFEKTKLDAEKEYELAQKLVHASQLNLLKEYEEFKTYDAKFAKSIDKLSALIMSLPLGISELHRWKYYNFTLEQVITDKTKVFEWDKTFVEIMKEYVKRIKDLELILQ